MVKFSPSWRILALTSLRARFQPPTRAIGQLGSSQLCISRLSTHCCCPLWGLLRVSVA